jgi:hypothetical protein
MASQPVVPESPLLGHDSGFPNPAALLEHLAETPRLARVTPATRLEVRPAPEMVPFGIDALDRLTGGLPRGCLTEISGPDSSGRTSVLLATLAAATRRGEICALIDASDAFHPRSGAAAGIDLTRLLWVRCTSTPPARAGGHSRFVKNGIGFRDGSFPNGQRPSLACPEQSAGTNGRSLENPVEQALRAADLLLQSGGFGLIAIDLAGVPVKIARRIPLTTWFRFRRAIEPTPTILLAIGEKPCAQTCATLCLQMAGQEPSLVADRLPFEQEALAAEQSLVPSLSLGQAKDGRWSLGKKPPAFSTPHSAVSSQLSAFSCQLAAVDSQITDKLQEAYLDPHANGGGQLSIFDSASTSALNSHPFTTDSGFESFVRAERTSDLAARSPQLEAPPFHAHLLEGLPIRIELLRSRLERKPAQSTTTFFSRDGACPVSACPVSACPVSPRCTPTNTVNAFALRAHG